MEAFPIRAIRPHRPPKVVVGARPGLIANVVLEPGLILAGTFLSLLLQVLLLSLFCLLFPGCCFFSFLVRLLLQLLLSLFCLLFLGRCFFSFLVRLLLQLLLSLFFLLFLGCCFFSFLVRLLLLLLVLNLLLAFGNSSMRNRCIATCRYDLNSNHLAAFALGTHLVLYTLALKVLDHSLCTTCC